MILLKQRTYIPALLIFLMLLLAVSTVAEAQRGWRTAAAGTDNEDLLQGIEDEKVLPKLRHLPRTHGGPNVPAEDGRFLYDLIMEEGYMSGLEIGTSNGYSALWIGLALRQNGGKLVTLEIDQRAAEEARENIREAGLDDVIEVITADALEAIPQIPGTFDFIFIDAHKPDYYEYFRLVRDRMEPGGAITAHNVTGRDRSMANFVEAIQTDQGLETEILSRYTISVSMIIGE